MTDQQPVEPAPSALSRRSAIALAAAAGAAAAVVGSAAPAAAQQSPEPECLADLV